MKDPKARLDESVDALFAVLRQMPDVKVKKPRKRDELTLDQKAELLKHGSLAFIGGKAGQATMGYKQHPKTGKLDVIAVGRTRAVRRAKAQVRRNVLIERGERRIVRCWNHERRPERTSRSRASHDWREDHFARRP
jgi:hypothetical protein